MFKGTRSYRLITLGFFCHAYLPFYYIWRLIVKISCRCTKQRSLAWETLVSASVGHRRAVGLRSATVSDCWVGFRVPSLCLVSCP